MKRLTSALMGLTLMLTFAVSAFAEIAATPDPAAPKAHAARCKSQRSRFPLIEAGGRRLAGFIRLIRFHPQPILAIRIFQGFANNAVL